MTPAQHVQPALASAQIHIRDITGSDLRGALADGWDDFKDKRGDIIIIGFAYPVIGLMLAVLALGYSLLPVVFPLAAGISILGPAVAAGFYELARRRERGLDSSWRHFFDVFSGPSFVPLVTLTVFLAVLFLLWLGAAWTIYQMTLGSLDPQGIGSFMSLLFTTPEGWTMIVGGNLVGLAFAALVLTVSAMSFPMLVDRPVDVGTAVATSVRAVAHNPVNMLKWGLIVAVLLLLGSIPVFIGLAVVLPWLGYATWHLYTRVVEIEGEPRRPAA
ncbi:hypothetical protein BSL82_12475 [Tardibacter chloracetimidivorans]|uniref:DUF2189 domain-containing protein n=1 Tax=Tardibacter chloracetimidivorans TaxID=1921510 RepID=A0A1L3ZWL6_9SPHN|nr:DUF2189 domain-containing protein [Tardibacter chloracetimidivorans]API60021.1 hypothetical protein BSL82_12475 [Tardibacter chloracetimidivorans]